MKIAVDLRSLSSGTVSGVENYTVNLLDRLLPLDRKNSYTLFYNAWRGRPLQDFQFVNSQFVRSRIPNKILNAAFKFRVLPMERLAGKFDCLFLPNLNQFHVASNVKVVLTVHDLSPVVAPEFYNAKRRLWHYFLNYKAAFTRANLIFAVSEYTKRDLIKLFDVPESKIKVVYPGVDHAVYRQDIPREELRAARNRYGLPGEYILFLNTIEPRKNLSNLIKAFDAADTSARLVIAGRKGWKYRAIFRDIAKSRKRRNIVYLGYVSGEADKAAIIRQAKVLAYPSFYEGFGFQPLEAMACGIPALASQVTSLPEVTAGAALLVNPYDIGSMARGLSELLGNETLRQNLIRRGLERSRQFGWQQTAEKTLAYLNDLGR